jgi:hypothetical protein
VSWMGCNHLGVSWNIEHRPAAVCVEQNNAQLIIVKDASEISFKSRCGLDFKRQG